MVHSFKLIDFLMQCFRGKNICILRVFMDNFLVRINTEPVAGYWG